MGAHKGARPWRGGLRGEEGYEQPVSGAEGYEAHSQGMSSFSEVTAVHNMSYFACFRMNLVHLVLYKYST